MAISKVTYGSETLIDISQDTVDASHLLKGYTAHDNAGLPITGTYEGTPTGIPPYSWCVEKGPVSGESYYIDKTIHYNETYPPTNMSYAFFNWHGTWETEFNIPNTVTDAYQAFRGRMVPLPTRQHDLGNVHIYPSTQKVNYVSMFDTFISGTIHLYNSFSRSSDCYWMFNDFSTLNFYTHTSDVHYCILCNDFSQPFRADNLRLKRYYEGYYYNTADFVLDANYTSSLFYYGASGMKLYCSNIVFKYGLGDNHTQEFHKCRPSNTHRALNVLYNGRLATNKNYNEVTISDYENFLRNQFTFDLVNYPRQMCNVNIYFTRNSIEPLVYGPRGEKDPSHMLQFDPATKVNWQVAVGVGTKNSWYPDVRTVEVCGEPFKIAYSYNLMDNITLHVSEWDID